VAFVTSLALCTLAIVASGLMVGNELAVGVFVHPRLRGLDDRSHAAGAQALARVYGTVMPFWYGAVLLLTVLIAATMRPAWSIRAWLAIASTILWFCAIVFTLLGPVRINNEVIGWDLQALPTDWKSRRQQWDRLHATRVCILLVALACLVVACLMGR
jgi:Domain of unknown function (DUF1772)